MPAIKRSHQLIIHLLFTFFLLIFSLILNTKYNIQNTTVRAQEWTNSIAATYTISSENFEDGDIVSSTQDMTIVDLTTVEQDTNMIGVINFNPLLVYKRPVASPSAAIIRNGETMVNVTTLGGSIKRGDYITSSTIPGKGIKGTNLSGYMIGTAMEDLKEIPESQTEVGGKKIFTGQIRVAMGIGPAAPTMTQSSGGIFGTFKNLALSLAGSIKSSKEAERIIRYLIAGLITLSTLIVNFSTFGKNISKGIESIGRNPLAKVSIQTMIIINVVLVAILTIGGVILSLAIISL